ncbi:sperm-associated antigen 17-like isoform X2 [Pararge aegeria]|uniref:sperm-associated antigen 17-like isoform X2 n=1 Tax=Pararge aegeria TaxID=116150 RepID=UPI0019D10184|nr:sperm-associated antigen 17-like isoform X2 [Pararge aegeria]
MGPKKGKETVDYENAWRVNIEEARLDDEDWTVKVIFIEAAGNDQDRIYLEKFETYAAEERRFVIKNICKTETIFMVNQLGGEKKVKDDNLRVFEEGQAYLKEKKDIPPVILALIIKHLIIKMKGEYLFIKQQKLKVREGMKRESSTMIDRAEVRGTVNLKFDEPPEVMLPPLKGKKGEVEAFSLQAEDANKKYSTLLRIRGEEWRDKVYIDDYPTEGPNLYVAVTGFVEPNLAACLIKIGIPLTAIIQIRIDPSATIVPSTLIRATKRGQSHTELLAERSHKFWEDLQLLRLNENTTALFKNTAFVLFSPPYWNNDNLSGSPEKVYDELCYLMYDLQDLSRQHNHYLENMDIINIPEEHKSNRYLGIYDRHIDSVPFESISTYLVLDSILQTVTECQHINEKSRTSSLATANTLNNTFPSPNAQDRLLQSQTLVKHFIKELCQIDSRNKNYRLTYGDEYESQKNPKVINYGDLCKHSTFHLGNINLDNIVWSMLLGMPINKLWMNRNKASEEIQAKINFHVNVLLSCFDRTDVETAELNRLIHILACRKIYNNRSSLKRNHLVPSTISEFKKTYLKRSILAEPLSKSTYKCASSTSPSFPSMVKSEESYNKSLIDEEDEVSRIKFLFDCPDISELVSAAEIVNEKPISHVMIDDFEYFEDFSGTRAFQIINDAFNKFNCVDYKYCEVTDCFLLMFFNSHDKDGVAREEWRCQLPTPLCLQDFFDFVLEEHYDWIKDEEKIYDENLIIKSQSENKDLKGHLNYKACVEEANVQMDLLLEGSLKYEEIAKVTISSPENSEYKNISSKKMSFSSIADSDVKSIKKTKSPANVTPKLINPQTGDTIKPPKKVFSGYNLCDRRVEVFGKDCSYFSKDGTRISSFYSLLIPMNLEYVSLNIVPGNGQNEFWFHKAIGDFISSEIIDTCESFRITSEDQVIIYIKKQKYQIPIPLAQASSGYVRHKENSAKSPSRDESIILPQIFESKSYHSLYVTWPNGLVTESVYEDNSPIFCHIKQYYITPPSHLDEEMRCVSLKGEVIIYKNNGDINILQPYASCINITKYRKEVASDEVLEDISSAASSDKSKKIKEKGKGKDKINKTASKSSKTTLSEDEGEVDLKPTEYKLVIEEFETIGTNGLRQKWINNDSKDKEKLLIKTATDYCLGEVFSKRMDGTTVLLNKDGVQIVTFPDNTRILTRYIIDEEEVFPEWTDLELEYFSLFAYDRDVDALKSKGSISQKRSSCTNSNSETSLGSSKLRLEKIENEERRTDGYISIHVAYTIEHPNFTTITIDKSKDKIAIESTNNTCVSFDKDNNYEFILDSRTSAKFNGENVNISYEACSDCKSFTTCEVKVKPEEISSVTQIKRNWLKMRDSFCNQITVNEEGNIYIMNDTFSDHITHSEKSFFSEEVNNATEQIQNGNSVESAVTSHGKCNQMYQAKSLKFFILARDLTCSELVHREIIEQYKQACRWQPWCSINQYDTFGDYRTLWSILSPVHLNESEHTGTAMDRGSKRRVKR